MPIKISKKINATDLHLMVETETETVIEIETKAEVATAHLTLAHILDLYQYIGTATTIQATEWIA